MFLLFCLLCRRFLLGTFELSKQLECLASQHWRSGFYAGAQSSSALDFRGARSLSSCCQAHPQSLGCQSRYGCSDEKNYGCRNEYYSIRVLDYTQTHTHTHTHTQTHTQNDAVCVAQHVLAGLYTALALVRHTYWWSCLTSISLSFTHADTLTHTSTHWLDSAENKPTDKHTDKDTVHKKNHLALFC